MTPTENVTIPTLVFALPDGRQISVCLPEADGSFRARKGITAAEFAGLAEQIDATAVPVPDQEAVDVITKALSDLRNLAYPTPVHQPDAA